MSLSMHSLAATTFTQTLEMLSALLDKSAEHVRAEGGDPDKLLHAQLAPDMFPLVMQIQIVCDFAKDTMAKLAGTETEKFDMTDTTIGDLKARIDKAMAIVKSVPETAFAGAEARKIVIPNPAMKIEFHMNGEEYLRDWVLPHFYFHAVTAYDILRREGVQIGKRDYMPHVARYIRPMA